MLRTQNNEAMQSLKILSVHVYDRLFLRKVKFMFKVYHDLTPTYISENYVLRNEMSNVMRKPTFWLPTWSNTNQAVQLQKMAIGLKFQI